MGNPNFLVLHRKLSLIVERKIHLPLRSSVFDWQCEQDAILQRGESKLGFIVKGNTGWIPRGPIFNCHCLGNEMSFTLLFFQETKTIRKSPYHTSRRLHSAFSHKQTKSQVDGQGWQRTDDRRLWPCHHEDGRTLWVDFVVRKAHHGNAFAHSV